MGKELIEAGAAVVVGLCALWYMRPRPKPPESQGLVSRVLK